MDEVFSKRNDILTALSALFCAAFSLGWFEYYFVHTFWVYLIAIAILVSVILKSTFKIKFKKFKPFY